MARTVRDPGNKSGSGTAATQPSPTYRVRSRRPWPRPALFAGWPEPPHATEPLRPAGATLQPGAIRLQAEGLG